MPNAGVYVNRKISAETAMIRLQSLADNDSRFQFTSALGHQGSADAFNALFPGLNCEANRIPAVMQPGDEAIALKVLGRLPEGAILTLTELEAIGFELYHIQNLGLDALQNLKSC